MKPKFSVALIARNESKTLPRLMESLKEFQERGGEVLLLDTGSTDNTAQVARDLGCKVTEVGEKFIVTIDAETAKAINEKFVVAEEGDIVKEGDRMFDYSSARNFIGDLAENDMLATPDCDEIFTKFDIDKINEVIEAGTDQLEYNFVFSHDDAGNDLVKFMHCKFYNRKKLQWTGIIHEVLTSKILTNRQFLDESVIKLEHWQNPETNRGHYLTGLAYDCYKHPENDRNAHYLGRELIYTGRFRSAIEQLKRHVAMNAWATERSQSMVHIGEALFTIGESEEAISWMIKAFNLEPNRREPLMKIAEHFYKLNQPDHVIAYVAAALQIKGTEFYANYQPYYEHVPHEMMYWALWQKGELRASKDHFDVCFALQPFNSKYLADYRWYYNLPKISFVLPTKGRPEGLERCVVSIEKLNYPPEKIEVIVLHDGEIVEPGKLVRPASDSFRIFMNPERQGLPKTLKRGVDSATGEWIVFASNDTEFTPDSIMAAYKTCLDNGKLFMAFNTGPVGPDEGNICEHFMIHKRLLPKINGEVFDTEFNHVGVDNLLWEQMKKLGQAMRCERAVVIHHHFTRGAVMDETYKLGWNEEEVKRDRALLAEKLVKLSQANGNSQEKFNG